MIARHEAHMDKSDIWSKLAGALPAGVISWRQDGKPTHRDGRYFARFVAYIEANTVRERLDSVVPGEWDLTLDLLPTIPGAESDASCSFKARLQILGVIREDVGTGKDYKQAATDAFKRAAVRFGIGHELYAYEQNWVQVDGDGKYAKPLEDPQTAYVRRYGNGSGNGNGTRTDTPVRAERAERAERADRVAASADVEMEADALESALPAATPVTGADNPPCPKCAGKMWDNRATKRNPKAPDFKCRDRSCDGVIWPPKGAAAGAPARGTAGSAAPVADQEVALALDSSPLGGGVDDIPF
ncbi:MAG TPA: Rad52/Rad22 family DNA repair protein [Gemmatimonadaceae bacterium]|nr:Rad52/Rad22 family DNA repair protein [Gemmatimonadaceae bacterium]